MPSLVLLLLFLGGCGQFGNLNAPSANSPEAKYLKCDLAVNGTVTANDNWLRHGSVLENTIPGEMHVVTIYNKQPDSQLFHVSGSYILTGSKSFTYFETYGSVDKYLTDVLAKESWISTGDTNQSTGLTNGWEFINSFGCLVLVSISVSNKTIHLTPSSQNLSYVLAVSINTNPYCQDYSSNTNGDKTATTLASTLCPKGKMDMISK
ncbi:MAG: hypothetical protein HKL80_11310 [Acidimicrobiales bacterium]|nr:hypothetical protein [Acidimicrobiales bacterium]